MLSLASSVRTLQQNIQTTVMTCRPNEITLYIVCSVPWGDILSTVRGVQYREGIMINVGDILSTVGDIMSTVGSYLEYRVLSTAWGVMSTVGAYHDAIIFRMGRTTGN